MSKSYKDIIAGTSANIAKLRKNIPEVMQGFYAQSGAADKAGALDEKTKELIAMALSVAARCDPCLGFHAKALVKYGASRCEVEEMLACASTWAAGRR
jgi:AhpD family alkylhydroperoxidase